MLQKVFYRNFVKLSHYDFKVKVKEVKTVLQLITEVIRKSHWMKEMKFIQKIIMKRLILSHNRHL